MHIPPYILDEFRHGAAVLLTAALCNSHCHTDTNSHRIVKTQRREAARTMASSAEPYRKGFVPMTSATKGDFPKT